MYLNMQDRASACRPSEVAALAAADMVTPAQSDHAALRAAEALRD